MSRVDYLVELAEQSATVRGCPPLPASVVTQLVTHKPYRASLGVVLIKGEGIVDQHGQEAV